MWPPLSSLSSTAGAAQALSIAAAGGQLKSTSASKLGSIAQCFIRTWDMAIRYTGVRHDRTKNHENPVGRRLPKQQQLWTVV